MKIMFVGLGLIGGSMAMALEGYPDLERYAVDGDEPTRLEALGRGVVRAADFPLLMHIDSLISDGQAVNIPWDAFEQETLI